MAPPTKRQMVSRKANAIKSEMKSREKMSVDEDEEYIPPISDCNELKFKAIKIMFDILAVSNNGVFQIVVTFVYAILE